MNRGIGEVEAVGRMDAGDKDFYAVLCVYACARSRVCNHALQHNPESAPLKLCVYIEHRKMGNT